ncbi:MAG: hypothetical protein K2G90_03385, partial [Muribaculaceae bacterium]|nr:hypothetical protein [Muribaculaceae bacterium]
MKFDISAVSRSAVTTAGNITRSPFALFGDRIPTAFAGIPSAEKSIIYFNTPVSFSNSAWTTPEPQFWYDKHEHSFVAIHPASVISASDANIQYLNNQLSFSYTLPSDHTQISDIMVATHRRRYIDQREYDKNN